VGRDPEGTNEEPVRALEDVGTRGDLAGDAMNFFSIRSGLGVEEAKCARKGNVHRSSVLDGLGGDRGREVGPGEPGGITNTEQEKVGNAINAAMEQNAGALERSVRMRLSSAILSSIWKRRKNEPGRESYPWC
jgi:hypothetical protein